MIDEEKEEVKSLEDHKQCPPEDPCIYCSVCGDCTLCGACNCGEYDVSDIPTTLIQRDTDEWIDPLQLSASRYIKESDTPDAGSLTFAEIEVACANMGINLECGGCASEFYTGHTEPHDEACTRRSATLTPSELSSLQTIAVAASPDVSRCLEIIERLTGQKIVVADEKTDDAALYKCYYCGLPKSEHSNGTVKISKFECGGLVKCFYPIRKECRSYPEITANLLGKQVV